MSTYETQIIQSADSFDKSEWDYFVDESPQGSIFCRSWWLEAVCPKGFEILVLRKEGRIVAGMPMVRSRMLGHKIIRMPKMTQTLGVLLGQPSSQKYEKRLSTEMNVLRELVQTIPQVDYFSMTFHHSFTNWLPFYWAGYQQMTRYTYVIEDTSDLDIIFNNMSQTTRNNIRKSKNRGIVVEDSENINTFLELNRKTFARQGKKPPWTHQFISRLDSTCAQHNARTIFLAKDKNDKIHAAVYVVHDKKCMYALMSGSDPELRSSAAHHLAKWKCIEFAHKLNIRFDFEGSMMENVECFNRGFGASQRPYFRINKDKRNILLKVFLRLGSNTYKLGRALRNSK